MTAYADTSFLFSLYAPDVNSVRAASLMSRAALPVYLTALGELELTNALHLRVFRKELSAAEIKTASAAFRHDLESGIFSVRPLPAALYHRALRLTRKHTAHLGARTLDILHVASAVILQADVFYTFDRVQKRLARTEGFSTP